MTKKHGELKEWYSQRMTDLYLKLVDAQERSPEDLQRVIDAEAGQQFDFLPRDTDFAKKEIVH